MLLTIVPATTSLLLPSYCPYLSIYLSLSVSAYISLMPFWVFLLLLSFSLLRLVPPALFSSHFPRLCLRDVQRSCRISPTVSRRRHKDEGFRSDVQQIAASSVQYSSVQYSSVHFSSIQFSSVQFSSVHGRWKFH